MGTVHDVLKWANRTAVAQEITRRGYRVSPETLNRWYRQRSEVPAVVEHIVFDLFGIGHEEAAPPVWAERLEGKMDQLLATRNQVADESVARVIAAMTSTPGVDQMSELIGRLEGLLRLRAEDPHERTGGPGPAEPAPPEQGAG